MKNDEFENVNPDDTDFDGADDFADTSSDFGGNDGFDSFDEPPAKADGNTLGDLWRSNPLIKFAVIGFGVIALIIIFRVFTGGPEAPKSSVGTALRQGEAPGGQTTEAYRDAIEDVNEQRLERALRDGTSSIPIPTAGTTTTQGQAEDVAPPVVLDDPLANWRAAAQTPARQNPPQNPSAGNTIGGANTMTQGGAVQEGPPQPMGPSPEAVNALSSAMSQQMQSILGAHEIRAPRVMAVTSADFLTRDAATTGDGTTTPAPTTTEQEIIVPAGTIVYAQTLTEANTDAPGPVLARISSGALNGNRILGSFSNTERFLTLNFNTVVVDGVSHSIQAIAIDPKTTLPAVATEVDRRYFQRFILPAAASFIEGMGSAIAQRESTTVVVDGSVVTSSTRNLNTREELAAGLESGTRVIARELEREGDRMQPMIKVHAGTPIGILFLEPVIKPQ